MNEYTIQVNEGIYTGIIADWKLDIQEVRSNVDNNHFSQGDLMKVHGLMVEGRDILFRGQDLSAITDSMREDMYSSFTNLNELERRILERTMH
jgi:hypothetical protein